MKKTNSPTSKLKNKSAKNFKVNKRVTRTEVIAGDLLNKMTKGALDRQEASFEIGYNKIYSNKVKMVLHITDLKTELSYGYIETIKDQVRKLCGNITATELDIISVQYCKHSPIAFNKKMRNKESAISTSLKAKIHEKDLRLNPTKAHSSYLQEAAKYDPRLASSMEAQKATRAELDYIDAEIEKLSRRKQSYAMVNDYQKNGGTCMYIYNFLEIVARDQELALNAMDILKQLLIDDGFQIKEITDLENYQIAFSPTSLKSMVGKGREFTGNPYFSLSNTVPMTQKFRPAILSSNQPEMYIGQNMENHYRVDVNFTKSGTPENYLVIGDSKSGKSTWLKTALLTWLDNPYANIIIKEYKGKGWDKFMMLMGDKGSSITLDINNPKFINTYHISLSKDLKFSKPHIPYQMCVNITTKTLLALLNSNKNSTSLQVSLCTKLVERVFRLAGVNPLDPTTYKNSHSITYIEDTWRALENLVSDPDIRNTFPTNELTNLKQGLKIYFSPDGIKRNIFGKELKIDNLIFNSRVILFDYNVHSFGGSDSVMENEIAMRILQQSFIERLYCNFHKTKGRHTMVITEDLDEQITNPYILHSISEFWKSSSHLNVINFATLKSLDYIYSSKNSDNDTDILSYLDITGYVVGRSSNLTLQYLNENTELSGLGSTLTTVCNNKSIKYMFLMYNKFHSIPTCLIKMPLTKEILMSIQSIENVFHQMDYAVY